MSDTDPKVIYERFQSSIARHKLTIIRNDGVHRHIKCSRPDSGIMAFQIVTFPGYLVYVGDMGSFTFHRMEDMFSFFREDDGHINPGYWSQKLEAIDRSCGHEEFSIESFHENVLRYVRDQLELEDGDELPKDVEDELWFILEADGEHECVCSVNDFHSERIDFSDFWENDCRRFTFHFIWCCHAIVWAINRYDEQTTVEGKAMADKSPPLFVPRLATTGELDFDTTLESDGDGTERTYRTVVVFEQPEVLEVYNSERLEAGYGPITFEQYEPSGELAQLRAENERLRVSQKLAHLAYLARKAPSSDLLPPTFDADFDAACDEYERVLIESNQPPEPTNG